MGKMETIAPATPPAARVPAVLARLRTAERELADLKLQRGERQLAAAEGRHGAKEALAALHQKIAAVAFEIECSGPAREHAARLDQDALVAYRAAIQTLPAEVIVAGLTRDSCCGLCGPATGCVIAGNNLLGGAGPCSHPVKERLSFVLDERGRRIFRYRDNPQASKVFDAACEKLNVRKEFA